MRESTDIVAEQEALLPRQLRVPEQTVSLRRVDDTDLRFLRELYGTTRAQELAQVDWSDAQKAQFLDFQFHAQHTYYNEHFADARRDIIEVEGKPVGRLYLQLRADEIRLIDIALLPEQCGQGIGGALLEAILGAGRARSLPVAIHVEQNNPALRLYQRLGFAQVEEQGIYYLMRWTPPAQSD